LLVEVVDHLDLTELRQAVVQVDIDALFQVKHQDQVLPQKLH
jgi:hypothetical protein